MRANTKLTTCDAASPDLALLDRQLIKVTGQDRIEACDLLSRGGQFIHVKRQCRSATLSHLFSQGSVSFQLLGSQPEYRAAILDQVKTKGWKLPFHQATVDDRSAVACVYVVSAKGGPDLADALPFFSKVNLRMHKEAIEQMGFKVAACTIPIVAQ